MRRQSRLRFPNAPHAKSASSSLRLAPGSKPRPLPAAIQVAGSFSGTSRSPPPPPVQLPPQHKFHPRQSPLRKPARGRSNKSRNVPSTAGHDSACAPQIFAFPVWPAPTRSTVAPANPRHPRPQSISPPPFFPATAHLPAKFSSLASAKASARRILPLAGSSSDVARFGANRAPVLAETPLPLLRSCPENESRETGSRLQIESSLPVRLTPPAFPASSLRHTPCQSVARLLQPLPQTCRVAWQR